VDPLSFYEHGQSEVVLTPLEAEVLRQNFTKQIEIWPSIEVGRYWIKARSFVGVIILPTGRTLSIYPKIAIPTLFALIARVYDPNQEIFNNLPHPYTTVETLFEFIVSFFASHVEDLIARGLLRGYQSEIEESQAIRGRLLISEPLPPRPGLYDRHWCSYRHFTPDIFENRILLWTAYSLRQWQYTDQHLSTRLYRLQHALADVQLDQNARILYDQLRFHRLNDFYQPALTLAKLLLDHLSFTGTQGSEPFFAFMIDMNLLFQQYLTAVLKEELQKFGYQVNEQEHHMLDFNDQIWVRPDLIIYRGQKPCLIIDAKYKLSAALEDIYQMIAYCHALNHNQAILIHPASEDAPTGMLDIRGPGHIKVKYLQLNLGGDASQLINYGRILSHKILNILDAF
jgi:5-methylcytosine-specific restriction enzyme subunit McrC